MNIPGIPYTSSNGANGPTEEEIPFAPAIRYLRPPGCDRILFHRAVPRHCFLPYPTAYSLQSNQARQEGAKEDVEESDTRRYTPPGAEGQEDSTYDVEQSPDEIAKTLLEYVPGSSEEDETSSTDSLEDNGDVEGGWSLTRAGLVKQVQKDESNSRSEENGDRGSHLRRAGQQNFS